MNVWKVEFLKYRYFFITIYSIEIILDICTYFNLLSRDGTVDTVYLFWQMLSWIAIVAFAIYSCYSFFNLGKDYLLHLLPYSRQRVLLMKGVVFGCYMILYFIMQCIRYLIILPSNLTTSLAKLGFIYCGSKAVSIIAFFALMFAIMSLVKMINNKVISAVFFAGIYVFIIAIQGVLLYNYLSENQSMDWIIGIVEDMKGMNQYINIMPINFVPKDVSSLKYVEETFNVISVVMNAVVCIISFGIFYLTSKKCKFNYLDY